jgi:hypothetical protein
VTTRPQLADVAVLAVRTVEPLSFTGFVAARAIGFTAHAVENVLRTVTDDVVSPVMDAVPS